MDQLSEQRINLTSNIPLRPIPQNQLPFVNFLSTKENHVFYNNSLQWSTPRRLLRSKAKKCLQIPLVKVDESRPLVSMIKGKAVSPVCEANHKIMKQHSIRGQHSSKPTKCLELGQLSSREVISPTCATKKLTKLLKVCVYLDYDVITSPSCNQQIHNTAINHSLPLSYHFPSTLTYKINHPIHQSPSTLSPRGCPFYKRRPKQKRIQTDPTHLDFTLDSNS